MSRANLSSRPLIKIFVLFLFHFNINVVSIAAMNPVGLDSNVSVDVKKKPLYEVMDDIANGAGYTIVLKGEVENNPVSLKLHDVTLDKMLKRLFEGTNYTTFWDHGNRRVVVSVYGEQKNVRTQKLSIHPMIQSTAQFIKSGAGGAPVRTIPGPDGKPIAIGHTINRGLPGVSISGQRAPFTQTTSTINY